MGKLSDLLIENSIDDEMNAAINNAREQHDTGYIQFLEEQLEKAEILIKRIKDMADDEIKVSTQESMVSSYINNYYNDKK
tara:strand:- start:187 stop:426 length:240 start_codon:yes stop_codon:yes gene_type:complete